MTMQDDYIYTHKDMFMLISIYFVCLFYFQLAKKCVRLNNAVINIFVLDVNIRLHTYHGGRVINVFPFYIFYTIYII